MGRRSMFQPPSLDEQAEGHAMSRRTAQIVLFAVGFVCPIGKSGLRPFPLGNSNMIQPGLLPLSYLYHLARLTMRKILPRVLAVLRWSEISKTPLIPWTKGDTRTQDGGEASIS